MESREAESDFEDEMQGFLNWHFRAETDLFDWQCSRIKRPFHDFLMTNVACDKPLGLQSGWVENSQMTASTVWDWKHAAWRGRLNMPKQGTFRGSWSAKYNNQDQWLQVCEMSILESLSNDDGDAIQKQKQYICRFRLAKQQLCTCITLFFTFLCRHCSTTTWNVLILRFMEEWAQD